MALAVEAQQKLTPDGIAARVVSLPSLDLFEAQNAAYRNKVLPPEVTARVVVEAGCRQGWDRYLGAEGKFIGVDNRFGASAPASRVFEELGITVENVYQTAKSLVSG